MKKWKYEENGKWIMKRKWKMINDDNDDEENNDSMKK